MLALIDYGMGNLLSVSKALESVGADVKITADKDDILNADHIVLPGVGNFGDGMKHLAQSGLAESIITSINSGKPFLGICLGMQLLMEESEEAPGIKGLGIFKGKVVKFPKMELKVPHMGWNNVKITPTGDGYFADVPDNSYFYFVHSYYVAPENPDVIAGTCNYSINFAACLGNQQIFATQFHPEKSQDKGLQLLKNFIKIS